VPEDVRVQMRSYMLLRFNAAEEHREVRGSAATQHPTRADVERRL
jgi:hypothetical protein